jgi:hypothetical protein
MVVTSRLQCKGGLAQTIAGLKLIDALQQLGEACGGVVKEQSFEQCSAHSGTEKSVVAILCHIDADNDMLCRSSDLSSELTELGVLGNVVMLHDNLLLADV